MLVVLILIVCKVLTCSMWSHFLTPLSQRLQTHLTAPENATTDTAGWQNIVLILSIWSGNFSHCEGDSRRR